MSGWSRPQTASTGSGTDGSVADDVAAQLSRADLSRHLAFFYDSMATQLEVAATFIEVGLDRNNRCLYFIDTSSRSALEAALRSTGVDVDARVDAGDLVIRRGEEAYAAAGFDPDRLISLLAEACDESVAASYDGLWVAGEVSWCFHTDLAYDHVVDFEADFEAACPERPITALCQYDLNQFNTESVAKALWTHRHVIYRGVVCENPFYIPPEEFRGAAERPLNTQLMLEQAYSLAAARQEVERRRQRLSVLNRVLRHDVRNDLNVTRGLLNLVREAEYLDRTDRERIDTAIDHVEDVFETANRARYIQQTVEHSTVRPMRLDWVLTRAVDRITSAYPDATLTVDGDDDVVVVADTNLDIAFAELFRYAVRTWNDDQPAMSLTITSSPERVQVAFDYPGLPVPANDRRVLEDGGVETPLNHCNGLALWLVKWIVENGRGRIDLPADEGQPIRIDLKRAATEAGGAHDDPPA